MAEDATLRRTDELLAELIELVETARSLPMSASCVLPRERVLDLLDELREVLPPELAESRKVVAARDTLLHNAFTEAAEARSRASEDADAILSDARHQAEQIARLADEQADQIIAEAEQRQAHLVAASTVHQAAVEASTRLRAEAEAYRDRLCSDADEYDAAVRGEADRYAREARGDAERYATKLTADAERYAETTLAELGATLRKAAATADQGRMALAERRARTWDSPEATADTSDLPRDAISA
jgi:cell division septum initiation protein DivIVA